MVSSSSCLDSDILHHPHLIGLRPDGRPAHHSRRSYVLLKSVGGGTTIVVWPIVALAVVLWVTHRANIARLT